MLGPQGSFFGYVHNLFNGYILFVGFVFLDKILLVCFDSKMPKDGQQGNQPCHAYGQVSSLF